MPGQQPQRSLLSYAWPLPGGVPLLLSHPKDQHSSVILHFHFLMSLRRRLTSMLDQSMPSLDTEGSMTYLTGNRVWYRKMYSQNQQCLQKGTRVL
jgi:hypothetical protein